MLDKRQDLRVLVFLFAFALLTAQHSIHAQTENATVAFTHWRATAECDDSILARRAVAALEQLKGAVLVYRSYDDFESDGRLARVPLGTFADKLSRATPEVELILSQLADAKLRSHLSNSLYSFRDGAFWWAKLGQQKVVTTDDLRLSFTTTTPDERFFMSTVPYTVVVHWRQANRYLLRAQRLIAEANTTVPEHTHSLLRDRKFDGSMR
jgi:hypothetical protein